MSDEKTVNSADDLTKTTKPSDIQLSEEELGKVAGGGFDGVPGEALDSKHKDS